MKIKSFKSETNFSRRDFLGTMAATAAFTIVSQNLNMTLEYDTQNMKITNCPEANDYFHYEYRKGGSL